MTIIGETNLRKTQPVDKARDDKGNKSSTPCWKLTIPEYLATSNPLRNLQKPRQPDEESSNERHKHKQRKCRVADQQTCEKLPGTPEPVIRPESWPIIKRKLIVLCGVLVVATSVVCGIHPNQRIIDSFLPSWNETDVMQRSSANTNSKNDSSDSSATGKDNSTRFPFAFRQCANDSSLGDCCNGLEDICDLNVNQVMFATLHNAMSTKEDGSFLRPNHRYSLEKSLPAGFRGLQLTLCKCGGVYEFCRGICSLGSRNPTEVFLNIDRFLRDNRHEVILIHIQVANENVGEQVVLPEFNQLLKNTTNFLSNLFVQDSDSQAWPSLRTMIEDDKRVLLFHSNGPTCEHSKCPPGMYNWWDYASDTVSDFLNPQSLQQTQHSCQLAARNVTKKSTPKSQRFLGLSHFLATPDPIAAPLVNSYELLAKRIEDCSQQFGGGTINMLYVDFWDVGSVVEVVQRRNSAHAIASKVRQFQ